LDKAPDAFRTISEVADDLDIPQHVLRFWETRFAQIKPMKRSGGRRYYRPDDVDLLRGIRRLLYGEGYTIRGVQRILREHGIKSVQGLRDHSTLAPASFASSSSPRAGNDLPLDDENIDFSDEDEDDEEVIEPMQHFEPARPHGENGSLSRSSDIAVMAETSIPTAISRLGAEAPTAPRLMNGAGSEDRKKLQGVLDDLIEARAFLDRALKEA